jgi:hypothetical protein
MIKAQRITFSIVRLWAFLVLSGSVCFGYAAPFEAYWLCRSATEVRTLRIEKNSEACVTWYTKTGRDEKVAEAKEASVCTDVLIHIKSTLLNAGWTCKNISMSRISR